jgi:SAM-dependent methyltransferase
MDQTIDVEQGIPLTVAEFYDALAPDYDSMTGFSKRLVHEKPFFKLLIERYTIHSALDAGCGTGFHSFLLAQLGVRVTALDVSPAMIREVERHAKELNLTVITIQAGFTSLRTMNLPQFDALFSMGNSVAHLLTDAELQTTFENFAAVLKSQGTLFIQNLNYDRILAQKDRVQSIKETGDKTFVRFYDYRENLLSFNILTIDRARGDPHQSMRTVQLRPWLAEELVHKLHRSGFAEIKLFGGIAMDEFQPGASKDLVILARKG